LLAFSIDSFKMSDDIEVDLLFIASYLLIYYFILTSELSPFIGLSMLKKSYNIFGFYTFLRTILAGTSCFTVVVLKSGSSGRLGISGSFE